MTDLTPLISQDDNSANYGSDLDVDRSISVVEEEYPWSKSGSMDEGSMHFRKSRLNNNNVRMSVRGNIWKSVRSIRDYEENMRMVPSHLTDNVRLFTNSSLESPQAGLLYMHEDCFYKEGSPEYALSINHDIYVQMMNEVNDASSLPLDLYFCCHGGDGAHSGVAHEDFVDIRVAILILGALFVTFLFIIFVVPWPIDDDDFFN
jgi:hypothetical protein